MNAASDASRARRPRFAVRAVLFDLDGTLADTAPDLGGALNRMRERRGLAALPIAQLSPVASSGARGMLAAGLDVHPGMPDYEALREEFLNEYDAALDRDSVLFDGVRASLDALVEHGFAWGVVTNKAERFAPRVLAGLGLRTPTLICGDTTAHAKPHPAPLLEACARLGVRADEAIYVGDDLRDVQAAHAAGMPAVVAGYGYLGAAAEVSTWQADAVIATPMALLELIELAS
ncbi:MAG TPA: HAD-IA family hydrolase [Methylibium sp.]|uniref:HAD-IA family hydrolase n=1 Tax=Methylibium sp. TaxID=2067992 RepID=UPI002DBE92EF|nr:HAD-IA family hydrolase [Methylibium sp.]HEU4457657.1 HAD-IA family hydrolase [Methylibium sp.]